MSESNRLGESLGGQRYTDPQLDRIARAAAPSVRGEKDAGKVYCPYCKLREARWKRHRDEEDPDRVHLFVYCTQCHKTGVTDIDFSPEAIARRADRDRRRSFAWLLLATAVGGLVWYLLR